MPTSSSSAASKKAATTATSSSEEATADACQLKYRLGRTLGEGSFSVVKLATARSDKSKWAIKVS